MKKSFRKFIIFSLGLEAKLVVKKYKPKIIAITGSVGKTGAKDAIYAALKDNFYVRKSEKSYNSEIGLPLTILGLPNAWNHKMQWFGNLFKGLWLIIWPHKYPEWLVLEAGVGKPGDMDILGKIIHADAVVFTYFGERPVHVEFFETISEVVREKTKLLRILNKKTGILILNADDPKVAEMKGKYSFKTLSYGFDSKADLRAENFELIYEQRGELRIPVAMRFRLNCDGNSLPVIIQNMVSKNYVYYALAALSFVKALGLPLLPAIQALESYENQPGRLQLIEGVKESLILDDTYNSSPAAVELALQTLANIETTGKRVAILGDMLELGKYTEEAHRAVGVLAKKYTDILVAVGPRSNFTYDAARLARMAAKRVFHFETAQEAGKFAEMNVKKGDIVLIKGSQGMRMERAVEEMMAHPEDKENLLARQDVEWLKKK